MLGIHNKPDEFGVFRPAIFFILLFFLLTKENGTKGAVSALPSVAKCENVP
jgi:hypothetical protein